MPTGSRPAKARRLTQGDSDGPCDQSDTLYFGIQATTERNDPPSVLTWQIGVADIDRAAELCRAAGIDFEVEQHDPAPGWRYRRLMIQTPSGYRLALEGPPE
jgi:hypothetical protein